jgi:hypothetical protein
MSDFYLVRQYHYDGYAGHNLINLVAYRTRNECLKYICAEYANSQDWEMRNDENGYPFIVKAQGQFEYWKMFIEGFDFGEEID